ncbi:M20 family metallo-hydrolase [Bordetella sp. 15P40C-2]|uniref:M20 family metallo-hydrolase n=1 Tax=Bordetella sp. 15P40C-2 TaxID=2572246 RepID=UPI00132C0C52|nr:M20 family metallo-hydrolase [Bordetella sp. 15P40C-2]MVW71119.1 hydantoinase/carbamoylase family amidase [Bordetella sp. 15P40C-2]
MSARVSDYVSMQRLWNRHEALARIGATAAGGVNRQALSAEDIDACRLLIDWGKSLGMQPSRDLAGNVFLRLAGRDDRAAPVLSGSHLDSQPSGGKYDGAYGVLAALEACEAIIESGCQPQRAIEVVAWMNEEGSRFAPGMMGSSVFAGARTLDDIGSIQDRDGVTVASALQTAHDAFADIPTHPLCTPVHSYVEAHIEQGPLLERLGTTIGVVSGIQGKRTFKVHIDGEAAHAGTSLRRERKDALLAAVRIIDALTQRMHDDQDLVKFTVGRLDVHPNAPSVVAKSVEFSIDLRHPDSEALTTLGDAVAQICQAHAGPCSVKVDELSNAMSLEFPQSMRQRIRSAAETIGVSWMVMLSAAGHDARYLHPICPSAMLFIPCHQGITHNEAESITAADAAAGARVLSEVLLSLADS